MKLNFGKTAIIPLWPNTDSNHDNLRSTLMNINDEWGQVNVISKAKYVGFQTGPGRVEDESAWNKAISKWEQRTGSWAGKKIGLQYSALVYNIFCASVLSFLGQLLPLPAEAL